MNETVMQALEIMGKGMLGIFIVTLVIIGVVIVLNKTINAIAACNKKSDGEE